jgi:anaphase-promoting complex subunit 13
MISLSEVTFPDAVFELCHHVYFENSQYASLQIGTCVFCKFRQESLLLNRSSHDMLLKYDVFLFEAKKFSLIHVQQVHMDSEVRRNGRLMDIVDQDWQTDQLPMEDVVVPHMELPELEPDNGTTTGPGSQQETLREQEQKWTDLGLSSLQDPSQAGSTNG